MAAAAGVQRRRPLGADEGLAGLGRQRAEGEPVVGRVADGRRRGPARSVPAPPAAVARCAPGRAAQPASRQVVHQVQRRRRPPRPGGRRPTRSHHAEHPGEQTALAPPASGTAVAVTRRPRHRRPGRRSRRGPPVGASSRAAEGGLDRAAGRAARCAPRASSTGCSGSPGAVRIAPPRRARRRPPTGRPGPHQRRLADPGLALAPPRPPRRRRARRRGTRSSHASSARPPDQAAAPPGTGSCHAAGGGRRRLAGEDRQVEGFGVRGRGRRPARRRGRLAGAGVGVERRGGAPGGDVRPHEQAEGDLVERVTAERPAGRGGGARRVAGREGGLGHQGARLGDEPLRLARGPARPRRPRRRAAAGRRPAPARRRPRPRRRRSPRRPGGPGLADQRLELDQVEPVGVEGVTTLAAHDAVGTQRPPQAADQHADLVGGPGGRFRRATRRRPATSSGTARPRPSASTLRTVRALRLPTSCGENPRPRGRRGPGPAGHPRRDGTPGPPGGRQPAGGGRFAV